MMHEHCHDIDLYFKKRNDSDKKKLVVSSRIGERERKRERKGKKGTENVPRIHHPIGNIEKRGGDNR